MDSTKKYLLIVEDSATQAYQIQAILESNNFICDIAPNGKIALEKIKNRKPDIIVSDIVMPEMDGYELCRNVKNTPQYKDVPVILLTALSEPKDVINGLQAGADNFLLKPYNEELLISRIRYILANLELRRNFMTGMGIDIVFGGKKYFINSDKIQIIDLLISTYENAIERSIELEKAYTALKEAKSELEEKNEELAKLNLEKNKFLGMAAHDIRNPIGIILNCVEILDKEISAALNSDQKEFLSLISTSGIVIMKLINELLDVSVIEAGELKVNYFQFSIKDAIRKNISLMKTHLFDKNISVTFKAPDENVLIEADQNKFDQIMNNLLSNAIKFSHRDTNIKVELVKESKFALISVQDEGQGIPANEINNLFKPFGKTTVRATGNEASTGLGLMIAKKIVEAHDGKIWVESEEGKGSTFYFILPLKAKHVSLY